MSRRALLLALGLGALRPRSADAETLLSGRVVQVADAVSFVVRTSGGRRRRVRLAGVAAASGAEGATARRALAALVFDRRVTLRAADAGESPLRARVDVAGTDVAATLVANGHLRSDGTLPSLMPLERAAQRLRLGIWASNR